MTKSNVTAEEKERLRREEMERLRNNFLNIRPDNDKALENDLRRQTPVPLSPQDLVLKESAKSSRRLRHPQRQHASISQTRIRKNKRPLALVLREEEGRRRRH